MGTQHFVVNYGSLLQLRWPMRFDALAMPTGAKQLARQQKVRRIIQNVSDSRPVVFRKLTFAVLLL